MSIMELGKSEQVEIRRVFRAPRQLVFDAWIKPEMLEQWWGPAGYTCKVRTKEARVGGDILLEMRGPDGNTVSARGKFEEIDPPARLVFTGGPVDANNKPLFDTRKILVFKEIDGETHITLTLQAMHPDSDTPEQLEYMGTCFVPVLNTLANVIEKK